MFENNSRTLDEIQSSQRSSNDKYGLGFEKGKKTGYSSSIKDERSYDVASKKKERKKFASFLQRTDMMPRRTMTSRNQQIFLGHCYSCDSFGHKSLNCIAYGNSSGYKKNVSSKKPKVSNHNCYAPFEKYDIECYKCNNYGHLARECKMRKSDSVGARK